VGSHIEMKNATTIMGQHQKHVKNLETECGYGEEVDGDQLREMVLQEHAPGLIRRLAATHHVFADAALADIDAEFEQLAVDAGCTPTGILPAHPADQIADFARQGRPSWLPTPHLPGPVQTKSLAMPGQDRLGLDDGQRRVPVTPDNGTARPTLSGPAESTGAVFSPTALACRSGAAEPGFPAGGHHCERHTEPRMARSLIREMSNRGRQL
jgi:hypothetical protein